MFLSSQSTHRERASEPTTRTFLTGLADVTGDDMKFVAVTSPKRKPEHAAVRSKATALLQPSFADIEVASPKMSSGDEQQLIIMSVII